MSGTGLNVVYRSEVLTDAAHIETVRDAWRDLHISAGGGPFSSVDWILAWASVFWPKPGVARVFVVWHGTQMVAALPMRLERVQIVPQLPLRTSTLRMLYDDRVGYHQILIRPGHEAEAARHLVEACRATGARYLDIMPMWANPAYEAFEAATSRYWAHARVEIRGAVADLSGGWDAYLGRRSPRMRKQLRALERKFEGADTEIRLSRRYAPDADEVLNYVFDVSARSWKALNGTDIGTREEDRAFFRALLTHMGRGNMLELCVMMLNGKPVANSVAIVGDTISYALIGDYDEAFANDRVGRHITAVALKQACTRGESAQDFLRATHFTDAFCDQGYDLMRLRVALRPGLARWVVMAAFAIRTLVERIKGRRERLTGRRKILGDRK